MPAIDDAIDGALVGILRLHLEAGRERVAGEELDASALENFFLASASAWSFVTNLMRARLDARVGRRGARGWRCAASPSASSDTQTLMVTSLRTFSVYEKMYEPSAAPMPNR